MTDIGFYHLQKSPLEAALPKLLEKVLQAGKRAVVMAGSEERIEALNNLLWVYDDRGFLPHGSRKDGFAEQQPVWLTVDDENPNGAQILVLTDGARSTRVGQYERCLDMFDGNDETALEAARARWSEYKGAGHAVTYWQQNDRGGWEKKV
ncbi:MAG: DNA polymerase III subunit chi [Alphaproteobacteria bacterium]